MSQQPPLFEKIKAMYGAYPKPMTVNEMVAKTMDKKSQTRRIPRVRIDHVYKSASTGTDMVYYLDKNYNELPVQEFIEKYSKWKVGDVLWVREPAKVVKQTIDCNSEWFGTTIKYLSDGKQIDFSFDEKHCEKKWFTNCQGIPNGCLKEMARDFRVVTNVRMEWLKNISDVDIEAEGAPHQMDMVNTFALSHEEKKENLEWWINHWDSTAPKRYKWKDDKPIFVYEFDIVDIHKNTSSQGEQEC